MKLPGDTTEEDVAGDLPGARPLTRRQFIDQIQGRRATVLDEGGKPSQVPLNSLPGGIREGQWIRGDRAIPTPSDIGNRPAAPGGDIDLSSPQATAEPAMQPPPGGPAASLPQGFRATHKVLGSFDFDPVKLAALAQDAKARHMEDLKPLIKIHGLEEYAPALAAAAATPGTSTDDMLGIVKIAYADKLQRDMAEKYRMTAEQQFSVKDKLANAAKLKAQKYQPGGGAAPSLVPAQAILQHGGTMEEAMAALGDNPDPKTVNALRNLNTDIRQTEAREVRGVGGEDFGLANRGVDAAKLRQSVQATQRAVMLAQELKQNLLDAGDVAPWIPFGSREGNPLVPQKQQDALAKAQQNRVALVGQLRLIENLPMAAQMVKLEEKGLGGGLNGPLDRLRENPITIPKLDMLIRQAEESMQQQLGASVRRESPVGHSQPEPAANPLTRAAKTKKAGGRKSFDEVLEEAKKRAAQ